MQINTENTPTLTDSIKEVTTEMEKQQYSKYFMENHKNIYKRLQRYTESKYNGIYTGEIGKEFIKTEFSRGRELATDYVNLCTNAIERINRNMAGEKDWYPPSAIRKEYARSCYDGIVQEYEAYLKNSGKTTTNVRARTHVVARFLAFCESYGIVSLGNMTMKCIHEAFESAADKMNFQRAVTPFLRYAYRYSLTGEDLSLIVPSVTRHISVPTVYTAEEIELLLSSIDRSTPFGKRNYAIVLIAARLGLRSCDICGLTLDNIHYEKGSIELVQSKTKEHLSLPLLPEIREALLDYIENSRPRCGCKNIFLKLTPPRDEGLGPVGVQTIVRRSFAKMPFARNNRHQGSHSLRSSLATTLLDEGNDYMTVQKVLGQTSPDSAKSYIKVDIEHLRPFSLSVPVPSYVFEKLLSAR